jgi:phosphohistidine phosphatase
MNLYIARHAVAHKRVAGFLAGRREAPLTLEGEERFRSVAGGILRLVPEIELVLSSPFVRAWRTVELLEQ